MTLLCGIVIGWAFGIVSVYAYFVVDARATRKGRFWRV